MNMELPGFLDRRLSHAARAAAWERERHAYRAPCAPEPTADELFVIQQREAAERGRAIDAEVCALLNASKEQQERFAAAARIAAIPEEAKAIARLKIRRKPLRANDAAAKPKRRRRKAA